jgi:5-methylcytosine-specific restriction protein A
MCLDEGLTRPADAVDHIRPLAHGGLDVDANTRNLCDPHHKQVTIEQFGHQVARGTRGITASGRPIGADHAWNLDRRPAEPAAPPRPRRRPAEAPGGRK